MIIVTVVCCVKKNAPGTACTERVRCFIILTTFLLNIKMQNHSVLCVPWVTEVLFSPLRVEGCFGDGRKLRIFRLYAEATSGEANPVTFKFWTKQM